MGPHVCVGVKGMANASNKINLDRSCFLLFN